VGGLHKNVVFYVSKIKVLEFCNKLIIGKERGLMEKGELIRLIKNSDLTPEEVKETYNYLEEIINKKEVKEKKIEIKYEVGTKVKVKDSQSKYYAKVGIIESIEVQNNEVWYYVYLNVLQTVIKFRQRMLTSVVTDIRRNRRY
jgi:hypothetical protein